MNPFNNLKINKPFLVKSERGYIWLTIRIVPVGKKENGELIGAPIISPSVVNKCIDKITGEKQNFIQFLN